MEGKMKRDVVIEKILERSGKTAKVCISGHLFHPAGGGQPGDSGLLEGTGFRAEVRDCNEGINGDVLSIVLKEGELSSGMSVLASVDEERNLKLSRMHTGEHILSRSLENILEGLFVRKVWIGETESTIYMTFPGEIGWEELFQAERAANSVVGQNIAVNREVLSCKEAEKLAGLKIKWERLDDESISVISIGSFDAIACSGSHVTSTGVVGGVLVKGFKGSPPDWEVRFTVERDEVIERQSRVMRVLMRSVGCEEDALPVVIRKLQDERREMEKKLEKARHFIALPWESVPGTDIPSFIFSMENFPPDLAVTPLKNFLKDHPESIVLFLSPAEGGGKSSFILATGDRAGVDLRNILRANPRLEAKGGGSPEWVQGVAGCGSIQEWKRAIGEKVDK